MKRVRRKEGRERWGREKGDWREEGGTKVIRGRRKGKR